MEEKNVKEKGGFLRKLWWAILRKIQTQRWHQYQHIIYAQYASATIVSLAEVYPRPVYLFIISY